MKKKIILFRQPLLILFLIFVLGLTLRVVNLQAFPNGFSSDEAYLGYNAYSILQTGKDINGHLLPLFLESFLYTPAGYSYFSIPFIKLFGLSVFSVRFASALFGGMTIVLMYFLTKSIFNLEKIKISTDRTTEAISLLAAFLIAVTPWHINLSRTASVSTVVTFFIIAGVYFFFRWLADNRWVFLILSFLLFFISLFFYIAPFAFLPFLILFLFVLYRKKINSKNRVFFITLFVIFMVPVVLTFTSPKLSLRVGTLSLSKNPLIPILLTEAASRDGVVGIKPVESRIFHNKISVIGDQFLGNYFKHFSYDFLFRDTGFPERYKIPDTGLFYPVFLLLIALGIYISIRYFGTVTYLLLGWILISPIGSGFASDDIPNLQRTLFMLPPIIIFSSIGFAFFINNIKKKSFLTRIGTIVFITVFAYESIFYIHQYYVHENAYRPWIRNEGYEKLISKINKYDGKFAKTVITNREGSPTLFLAFYNKYDPALLQKTIKSSVLRDTDRISFSTYEITQEECPVREIINLTDGTKILVGKKGILYVNSGLCKMDNLPSSVKLIDTIYRSDGSKAFYILDIM